MDNPDDGHTFTEILRNLRAQYAYIECSRYMMKEVFLWLQRREEIPNIEKYLLEDLQWTRSQYLSPQTFRFNKNIKKKFSKCGIKELDVISLWRLFQTVNKFFVGRVQRWTEIETLLSKMKNERDEILSTNLQKVNIDNETQLEDYLAEISSLVENILNAFDVYAEDRDYDPLTTEQRSRVMTFVGKIISGVKDGTTENNIGPVTSSSSQVATIQMNGENAVEILYERIINVSGDNANLILSNIMGNVSVKSSGTSNVTVAIQQITGNVSNQNLGLGTMNVSSSVTINNNGNMNEPLTKIPRLAIAGAITDL